MLQLQAMSTPRVRLAEITGALTLAIDLAFGQSGGLAAGDEHVLRTCLLALRLADRLELPDEDREILYWVAQLRFVGCIGHAHEVSQLVGDEVAARADSLTLDTGSPAAVFPWVAMGRQVVAAGPVYRLSDEESDAYFATRPRGHRLGATASPQSQVMPNREALDAAMRETTARYPEGTPIPRPAHWGGFRLDPETVEFWEGREDRLHDRLRYRKTADGWALERLAP